MEPARGPSGRGTGQASGRLPETIMHFCRVLRTAGLPIGAGRVVDALRAVDAVGLANRHDFHAALSATLVSRAEHRVIFDQAFHMFWRNPHLLERMMSLVLPSLKTDAAPEDQAVGRIAEALAGARPRVDSVEEERIEIDASLTFSDKEVLQTRDFEAMTTAEWALAKAAIARMRLAFPPRRTRRFAPSARGGRLDGRATLRATLKAGGDAGALRWQAPIERPSPIVILCDISGSMGRYSRVLLHFVHALTSDRDRVHSFLFGTRLTNITRHVRHRDIDVAVAAASGAVGDWSGGTRIGHCIHDFNRIWSRRVLGQGAIALLITDGLDREAGAGLGEEMRRLHHSCRRLIWLNPLLRYDKFEPKSLGIRAILPHVDEFRPVHNLASLADLAKSLAGDFHDRHR